LYFIEQEEGGLETVELAKKNPQNYVMKPQREGGGNSHFLQSFYCTFTLLIA